ncbi:MAG: F0F1 ATP synthase subunit B [Candidatus Lindowbacteria bacterium]|nr:F0F1 ATP synthase subunit B [Candidatus Lindowbacteria bacterium]
MADTIFYLAQETGELHQEAAPQEAVQQEMQQPHEEAPAVTSAHTEQPAAHGAEHEAAPPAFNMWIWTLIAFGIVLFVLNKFAFPRIMEMLDKRSDKIEGDLKNAELTREEAQKLLAEYKAQLDTARAEAKKIMDEGKSLGENLRKETVAKATDEANQLIKRAQEEIGREKEKAIKELQSQIADISIDVASKVIQKTLNKQEHGKLIDQYITEVGKLYEG